MLDGIDVYEGKGEVDWHKVARANRFAFMRGAYGDRADRRCEDNFARAKDNGLASGLYHFYRVTRPAQAQADLMCEVLDKAGFGHGDLPPVLDVEDNPAYDGPWNPANNEAYIAGLRLWLDQVAAHARCTPIIYTRSGFWGVIGRPDGFAGFPLWVAHYTTAPAPTLPQGWQDFAFWQYSQAGHCDGIAGASDMNRFNGEQEDLDRLRAG